MQIAPKNTIKYTVPQIMSSEEPDISIPRTANPLDKSASEASTRLERVSLAADEPTNTKVNWMGCPELQSILTDSPTEPTKTLILDLRNANSTLILDLRNANSFGREHFKAAVNVSLNPLILKRMSKKMYSNINVNALAVGKDCKDIYDVWLNTSKSPRKIILVGEQGAVSESELFILYNALTTGLSRELIKTDPEDIQTFVLEGGFKKYSLLANAESSIVKFTQIASQIAPSGKKTFSLALKLADGAAVGAKPINVPSNESPPESATDAAAPNDPYSRITHQILIGSDVIPLSEDSIARFAELGVTHVLNMASEVSIPATLLNSTSLIVKCIPVVDNTEQDLDGPLCEAMKFIGRSTLTQKTLSRTHRMLLFLCIAVREDHAL